MNHPNPIPDITFWHTQPSAEESCDHSPTGHLGELYSRFVWWMVDYKTLRKGNAHKKHKADYSDWWLLYKQWKAQAAIASLVATFIRPVFVNTRLLGKERDSPGTNKWKPTDSLQLTGVPLSDRGRAKALCRSRPGSWANQKHTTGTH